MSRPRPFSDPSSEGVALQWLRIGFAFSKRDLAAATGISCERLAVVEAGLTELSLSELDAIARAFEISPTEMQGELRRCPWPALASRSNEVARVVPRLREIRAERLLLWARSEPAALRAIARLDDERDALLTRLWRIDERTARAWAFR